MERPNYNDRNAFIIFPNQIAVLSNDDKLKTVQYSV